MGDYSQEYTSGKRAMIMFGFGKKSVFFKPFLNSLSFQIQRDTIEDFEDESIYTKTFRAGNFKNSKYNLGFSVLASNIRESIEIHKKFQILVRMICPNEDNMADNRIIYVKLANLISYDGGKGTSAFIGGGELKSKGFKCVIKSIKYSPIMELGFFEHGGRIFAKGYELSFDLNSTLEDTINNIPIKRSGYSYGAGGVPEYKFGSLTPEQQSILRPTPEREEGEPEEQDTGGSGEVDF